MCLVPVIPHWPESEVLIVAPITLGMGTGGLFSAHVPVVFALLATALTTLIIT